MKKVVVDIVFLYVLSLPVVIAARNVGYLYNLIAIAVLIWISLTVKEKVTERLKTWASGWSTK